MTTKTTELVKDMSFAELKELAVTCQARMAELRATGVATLAGKFQQMAATEVGMSMEEMIKVMRKMKTGRGRGRPRKETSNGADAEI